MKGKSIVNRFDALVSQRKNMDSILQDIEKFVVPFRGEFYSPMLSESEVRHRRTELYDNTANVAVNLLASQMHGNLTSPVTKWFGFRFRDPEIQKDQESKEWLEIAESKTWETLQESDFDTAAPEMFLDVGSFGTSIVTMEDVDDLVWRGVTFNALPIMDSYFEAGPDGLPYATYRKLRYTKYEMTQEFDLTRKQKQAQDDSDVEAREEVIFVIYKEPKNTYEGKPLAPGLRPVQWRYVHKSTGTLLKKKGSKTVEGGYYDFPAMTVRWQKTAGSKWGFSPAWLMLADIKQLNVQQFMVDEAWAKAIDPPMKASDNAIIGDLDNVPGGLTIIDDPNALQPLYPASSFQVGYEGIDRKQLSIRAGFFVDKLELKDSPAMTAYEVQVRYERMLRLLAPTAGRLKKDVLMPTVQGIFSRLLRMGQLPDPPQAMKDAELDIEFTGPLFRALKGEIADGMERWLIGLSQQLEFNPEATDIVDFDDYNRTMAEQRGVPAHSLKTEKEVLKVREERAAAQKQMMELQQAQEAGKAAQELGKGGQEMQSAGEVMSNE